MYINKKTNKQTNKQTAVKKKSMKQLMHSMTECGSQFPRKQKQKNHFSFFNGARCKWGTS